MKSFLLIIPLLLAACGHTIYVLDSKNQPIEGATVHADGMSGSYKPVLTNKNGRARFHFVGAPYQVSISKAGYDGKTINAMLEDIPRNITLKAKR